MASVVRPTSTVNPVHVPVWAWLLMAAALLGAFLMLQDNGALLSGWERAHELFHDGRHALGFPCH